MRSDKDEIARLRAEVIALQEKIINSPKPSADRTNLSKVEAQLSDAFKEIDILKSEIARSPDYSSIDFSSLTKQMASLMAENALLLEKIECINTLKIKVSELESANLQLIDRINRGEYGFLDQQQHRSGNEPANLNQVP